MNEDLIKELNKELIEAAIVTVKSELKKNGIVSEYASEDIVNRYQWIVLGGKVFLKDRDGTTVTTSDIVRDSKKSTPFYFDESKITSINDTHPKEHSAKKSWMNVTKIDEEIKQAVTDGNHELFRELRRKQGAKLKL